MAAPAVFGQVGSIQPGHEFATRLEVWGAGLHRHTQAGISYTETGADAIVLSGKYEDDLDYGALIFYTGKGGRSEETGRQAADQQLVEGNLALVRSYAAGLPVRVIRKVQQEGRKYYQYAGLYRITSYAHEYGRSGHLIFRFQLELLDLPPAAPLTRTSDESLSVAMDSGAENDQPAPRVTSTIQRIVRDTAVMGEVKKLHGFRCQVCSVRLEGPDGPYAEAAHIRPLGAPHLGPDTLENVLCLCPNHHVLFDLLAWSVGADGRKLLGLPGQLRRSEAHSVSATQLTYHRKRYEKQHRRPRTASGTSSIDGLFPT